MNPPLRFEGDSAIIDPEIQYKIDPATFISKSKNIPFTGRQVQGEAFLTRGENTVFWSDFALTTILSGVRP